MKKIKIKKEFWGGTLYVTSAILAIAAIAALVYFLVSGFKLDRRYEERCGDYIDLASEAGTVELCEEYLTKVISYLEANNLTSGNTGIIRKNYPSNDLGLFYKNLNACKETLLQTKSLSALEKSNVLMSVKESLADISTPAHISLYPNTAFHTIGVTIAIINMIAAFVYVPLLWMCAENYL